MSRAASLLFASLTLACSAGPGAQDPKSPAFGAPDPEERSAPREPTEQGPRADVLYSAPDAVPQPGEECIQPSPLPAPRPCEHAREDLAAALILEPKAADAALSDVEACDAFPRGLIRALRAEMGAPTCGDVLVAPVVGEGHADPEIPDDIRQTLVALGLGARLSRLAVSPPKAPESRKRDELEAYFRDHLFPWIGRQAQAIFEMASQGTHLSGYARGVVAIEAGSADMRFVEIARQAPLADEIAEHEEAKDLYYATLDERLEPRKARGRNAALVGLHEMARLGVRTSPRVQSARSLLSRVFGGRRINALDTLLVTEIPPEKADGAAAAIASRVPTPYASSLVGVGDPTPLLVRAHLQMGMPPALRRQVEAEGDARAKLLLARALFESGRTYFRAEDFQDAQAILTQIADIQPADEELESASMDELRLLRALSVALSAGPRDATEMIAKGPRFADSLGNLVILDGLGTETGELGGKAAFDAAYLRELVAPEAAPDYWADLAKRYLAASRRLKGAERKLAADRGAACLAIEKELRK